MNNVGGLDRVARIVIGAALIILAALGVLGVWAYIGIVPLLTGLLHSCPLYSVFGVNTCPKHKP
ncbi:DUF2892 domain-containing protein [Chitinibacter sp. S2-10]|uniref:YgaP family membrane protein n=1 Tax=Chitinibacter sp. S2-10 TaxID=3373597 RepID=UPI003977CE74